MRVVYGRKITRIVSRLGSVEITEGGYIRWHQDNQRVVWGILLYKEAIIVEDGFGSKIIGFGVDPSFARKVLNSLGITTKGQVRRLIEAAGEPQDVAIAIALDKPIPKANSIETVETPKVNNENYEKLLENLLVVETKVKENQECKEYKKEKEEKEPIAKPIAKTPVVNRKKKKAIW